MSEVWNKWQGHVIDGTFPLHRYLGGTDHSGVFLVELAGREPPEVAIKLVPVTAALGEAYLEHWDTAAGLDHPNLLRILQTGRWELDGLPFVYCVMEYSDQNLAQLLEHRAMTEDEAREMLPQVLSALSFLHNKNLVQGQLKPSNILVVGDQVKLASDTICRVSEVPGGVNTVSIYDPPEAGDGRSAAGDIWALGVTLFEALTRSPSLALDVRRGGVVLPSDFSPPFREVVSWCLSRRPFDRPKLGEIEARVRGHGSEGAPLVAELAPAAVGSEGDEASSVGEEDGRPAPASTDGVAAVSATGAGDETDAVDQESTSEDADGGAAGTPEVGVRTRDESAADDLESAREDAGDGAAGTPEVGLQARDESAADDLEQTSENVGEGAAGIPAIGLQTHGESAADDLEETSEDVVGSAAAASAARMRPHDGPAALDAESVRQAISVLAAGAAAARDHGASALVAPVGEGNALAGAPAQSLVIPLSPENTASIPALATLEDIASASGRAGSSANLSQTAEIEEFFAPLDESDEASGFTKPAAVARLNPTGAPSARPAPSGPAAASGNARAPGGASTSASGTYRAPVVPSTSASGTYRAPVAPSTSASGTYRAPVVPSTSASGTYRAPVAPSTSASGTYRAPVAPSTSVSGTYRAPTAPAVAASGTHRAPVAPSTSESGTYRAPTAPSTSASGTYRAPVAPLASASGADRAAAGPSTSTSGIYRAPANASTSASGTYRSPVGPAPVARVPGPAGQPMRPAASAGAAPVRPASTSSSGIYRSPVAPASPAAGGHPTPAGPSTSATGTHRAPVSPSTSTSGIYRTPVSPSTSTSGIYRAPASPSTSASGTYRSPVGSGPATRVPGPAGQGATVPLPTRPTSTSGIYKSPVAPGVPAQAAKAKSTPTPQRQWTSSEQITIRSPNSEPAVLQRIIGQPVTVMPAAVMRLQAEEVRAEGAPVDESQADEAELNPSVSRASTSQRYLILLCLVAAVIFPLCWAGLGAIRPHHDRAPTTQAPQVVPQQSATAATPIVSNSPGAVSDVEAPPGTMQPGDAATPAGGAGTVRQAGMSGGQAGTPGGQGQMPGSQAGALSGQAQMSGGSAVTDAVGASGRIGINLRIPGRSNSTGGVKVSGGAAPGGAHAPGGTGAAAAAGTSVSAARAADSTRSAASSDTTNMSSNSGGSAMTPGEHEEFPEIPAQIRKTIRGHVKVSVRVIIDEGGSVFAALVDSPGPSRYFDKMAIEAAKKWTFPPAESSSRLKLVRFDFTRDGTTGQAVEVQ